jgi:hypothetical protein
VSSAATGACSSSCRLVRASRNCFQTWDPRPEQCYLARHAPPITQCPKVNQLSALLAPRGLTVALDTPYQRISTGSAFPKRAAQHKRARGWVGMRLFARVGAAEGTLSLNASSDSTLAEVEWMLREKTPASTIPAELVRPPCHFPLVCPADSRSSETPLFSSSALIRHSIHIYIFSNRHCPIWLSVHWLAELVLPEWEVFTLFWRKLVLHRSCLWLAK